jgi:hypothetical protein
MKIEEPLPRNKHGHMMQGYDEMPLLPLGTLILMLAIVFGLTLMSIAVVWRVL